MEWGLGWGFYGGGDFDAGLREVVDEVVARFAVGWGLVGGGEETTFYVEGDSWDFAGKLDFGDSCCFEVAEAGAGCLPVDSSMRGVRGMCGLSRWTCWLEISIIWYSVMLAVRMGPSCW